MGSAWRGWCDELTAPVIAPLVDDYTEVAEGFDDGLHVAPDFRPGTDGDFVGLFDCNDAAVGPGVFGNGIESGGKVGDAHVQVATARTDGAEHSADAEVAGVAVGDDYVQCCHCSLHGDVGILPEVEALYGHVAGLRRGRDQLHLLTGEVCLLLLLGCQGVALRDVGDSGAGAAEGGERKQKSRKKQ